MRLYHFANDLLSRPAKIRIRVKEGITEVWFGGFTEPAIVLEGHSIEIKISAVGPAQTPVVIEADRIIALVQPLV